MKLRLQWGLREAPGLGVPSWGWTAAPSNLQGFLLSASSAVGCSYSLEATWLQSAVKAMQRESLCKKEKSFWVEAFQLREW